ncbi:hypothetical protein GMRT_13244 [Giardia muris]|uniref:Golgi apparatus membrane protein TVP23 homolog n=1 Tax=Giardia muris TaxID=5742 RepID=A0A4Z1T819_GIAMU|nr:hypothetical protein GMRT_13244 [Giardia muris]|eukprot:TNJ28719.1 hypothetical protein GMRT_13244 [Giardia muris]
MDFNYDPVAPNPEMGMDPFTSADNKASKKQRKPSLLNKSGSVGVFLSFIIFKGLNLLWFILCQIPFIVKEIPAAVQISVYIALYAIDHWFTYNIASRYMVVLRCHRYAYNGVHAWHFEYEVGNNGRKCDRVTFWLIVWIWPFAWVGMMIAFFIINALRAIFDPTMIIYALIFIMQIVGSSYLLYALMRGRADRMKAKRASDVGKAKQIIANNIAAPADIFDQ